MGDLARLGDGGSRARAPLHPRRQHEYTRMDISQHRPWYRPMYALLLFGLRSASFRDRRKPGHRGRHVQLLPRLWLGNRRRDRRCRLPESHARKPARISSACALAVEYSKDAAGLVQVIKVMPDGIDKTNLKQAYTVWAVCCGISGVVFLLSLLTQSYDLNRALSTTQGLRSNDRPRDEERTNEAKS